MSEERRITPSNPVRKLGRMDYEQCAALHNEINRLSWRGYHQESHITWGSIFGHRRRLQKLNFRPFSY